MDKYDEKAVKRPTVSVLMNCYNSAAFLKQAIDSVYAQTFQDFEILFVDNCSTDESAKIAKSYDKRLVYVKTDTNIPLYSARRFGLDYVRGEFLAILDCDDYWKPDKLEYQLRLMKKRNLDFVYGAYDIEFTTNSFAQEFYCHLYRLYNRIKMKSRKNGYVSVSKQILNYDINLQTVLLRAEKIGNLNFSPKLNLMGDYDFFIRFGISNKAEYYYDRKVVSTTRMHPGQLSLKSFRNWYKETRYLYLFVLRNKLSETENVSLKKLILFFKSLYLWEIKQYGRALKIKKDFRFESVSYFFHWLKFQLRYLLK